MRVRKFYSVEDAYERMGFWRTVEVVAGVVTLGDLFVVRSPVVFVIGAATWWVVDRLRVTFSALFWNQAEMLHTSSAQGEPGIFRFMSAKHQRQLAQKSFDKFSQRKR